MSEVVDGLCAPPPPIPPPVCNPPYEYRIYPNCTPTPPPKCEAPYEDRMYPDCIPTPTPTPTPPTPTIYTPTPPPPPTPPVPCTDKEITTISSCGTKVQSVHTIIPPASCDEFNTKNAENMQ